MVIDKKIGDKLYDSNVQNIYVDRIITIPPELYNHIEAMISKGKEFENDPTHKNALSFCKRIVRLYEICLKQSKSKNNMAFRTKNHILVTPSVYKITNKKKELFFCTINEYGIFTLIKGYKRA